MKIFSMDRTRLVTERFRVIADSEEDALTILSDEMDLPQVTDNCEITDCSTLSSEIAFGEVEEVEA